MTALQLFAAAHSHYLQDFSNLGQIIAGIAASVAIGITVYTWWRQESIRRRDLAGLVSAWAAQEANDAQLTDGFGVVIANGTSEPLVNVDLKTVERMSNENDDKVEETDRFKGQRFSRIPPGTYYSRHDENDGIWKAPVPVDPTDGQSVTIVDEKGGKSEIRLVPVTTTPEPKLVTFMKFTLGRQTWWRLLEERNSSFPLKVATRRRQPPTTTAWKEEFEESSRRHLEPPKKQDRSKNIYVQRYCRAFFEFLTGKAPKDGRNERVPVWQREGRVLEQTRLLKKVTLTGGHQGLHIFVDPEAYPDVKSVFFAGRGEGEKGEATVPTEFYIIWEDRPKSNLRKSVPKVGSGKYPSEAELEKRFEEYVDAISRALQNV